MAQELRGGGRKQAGEIGQRQFVFRQTVADIRRRGSQRTPDKGFRRKRIKFSDKTHKSNLAKRRGNSKYALGT